MDQHHSEEGRLAQLEKMRKRLEVLLREKEREIDFLRKKIKWLEEEHGIDFDAWKERD